MGHGGEWAGHGGEWMSQGQRQSGELGWKQTNEFFRSLPAPDRWHHLAVLSIHLTPTFPSSTQPTYLLLLLPLPSFSHPTFTVEMKKKKKNTGKKVFIYEQAS